MDNEIRNDDEIVEKINDADAEEIPPTPVRTMDDADASQKNDKTDTYAGDANGYAQEERSTRAQYTSNVYENAGMPSESESTARVLGVVALVCGILSLICCCSSNVSIICALAAVICGILSIKKANTYRGIAMAGIICGSIALVIVIIFAAFRGLAASFGFIDKLLDKINVL